MQFEKSTTKLLILNKNDMVVGYYSSFICCGMFNVTYCAVTYSEKSVPCPQKWGKFAEKCHKFIIMGT